MNHHTTSTANGAGIEWVGTDGPGNAARQEMIRRVALLTAQQQARRN